MTGFPPVPHVTGIAAPLLRANVDTDAIIPSREIKGVGKTGLADGLFAGWRYLAGTRTPDHEFVLNNPLFAHAPILLAGENFGCGSSREHAVWALHEYGVRAIIAPSFAPIFRSNCIPNGIIPVVAPAEVIAAIAAAGGDVTVDIAERAISSRGSRWHFTLDTEAAAMLAEGLDTIDLTMRYRRAITAFHDCDRRRRPWVY